MLWKWIKKVKDFNSWYSFGSNIVRLIIWIGISSGVGVSIAGVVTAIIKGVPWPITLMAGFAVFIAIGCLAATPLIIRAAIQSITPLPESKVVGAPIRPNYAAWKHVEKFTIRYAACLLVDLEPTTDPQDPKVSAWVHALCAAIRTGELNPFENFEGHPFENLIGPEIMRQRAQANSTTEIPKAALMDFAKRNNLDLKYLG